MPYSIDHRILLPDGRERIVHDTGEVIRDETGKPIRMIGTTLDITERKLADQRQIELVLEKERINMLTRFIRDAAHEFRTPLSIINSATYLLTRSDKEMVRQSKANVIEQQIKRVTRLLDGLMLLVRLESSEQMQMNPVNLETLLATECKFAHDNFGTHPVIRCVPPADIPFLQGDSHLLGEAFRQLIDNAMRFTPAEGVVTITGGIEEGMIWVEVADTGMGIPAEDLSKIFTTFWRRDDAHSTAGFGLGLSIVRRIIERHGGHVQVRSRIGEGTHIRVNLPIVSHSSSATFSV